MLTRLVFTCLLAGIALGQCLLDADVDGDGRLDQIRAGSKDSPLLVRSAGRPAWTVDPRVTTRECHWLEILGHRGIVILPHGMQVRFYETDGPWGGAWKARDLYSFYTASWQGGLLQADVDHDGLPDLFCGNYWIQSPPRFDLPWRLFAINAFHEHPLSASAQLYWDGERLLWVESRRPKGRVVWFRPPQDRKQLWIEEPHPAHRLLDCPQLSLRAGRPVISASKRRCR